MKGKKREERKTKQHLKAATTVDPFGFALADPAKVSPGPKADPKSQVVG